MHARIDHVLRDHHVGADEHLLGATGVAGLPVEDVIVRAALEVVPDHRGALVKRAPRVDHGRKLFVVNLDELEGVAGRVAVLGDHERDLLPLEADLVGRQDSLNVVGERGHPGQVQPGQGLAGDDRLDLGVSLRGRGVDGLEPRVGVGAAQHRPVQHAR